MPLLLDPQTPCIPRLQDEGIKCLSIGTYSPDIQVAVLNLMPDKESTEYHLLSRLGHSPLRLQIHWLFTETYTPKNVSRQHLETFYTTRSKLYGRVIDGLIVTGAPVERMRFEDVAYWSELQAVFDWAADCCQTTYAICWAAQAALYHFWRIEKYTLPKKLSGLYSHPAILKTNPLLQGIQENFIFPYSRFTGTQGNLICSRPDLVMAAYSEQTGPAIVTDRSHRLVMVTGHPEYDRLRMQYEYQRDLKRGQDPDIPVNAFPNDDPNAEPLYPWHQPAIQLYQNWLNRLTCQ